MSGIKILREKVEGWKTPLVEGCESVFHKAICDMSPFVRMASPHSRCWGPQFWTPFSLQITLWIQWFLVWIPASKPQYLSCFVRANRSSQRIINLTSLNTNLFSVWYVKWHLFSRQWKSLLKRFLPHVSENSLWFCVMMIQDVFLILSPFPTFPHISPSKLSH